MISRPTRSTLQSLTNLSRLPEWKGVQDLLATELAASTEKLLSALDAEHMRRLQGRCQLLRELTDLAADPAAELAKLKP